MYPIVGHSSDTTPRSQCDNESDSDGEDTVEEEEITVAEEGEAEEVVGDPVAVLSGRPRRATKPPSWHADYVMNS